MKKRVNTLPTVTVAVCALNEENNIAKHLTSIVHQKEKGYRLKEVLVYSDGSTDKTAEIIKSFASKIVTPYIFDTRIGKSSRLNDIFQRFDSDYLILTDADVIFAVPNVIEALVVPMEADSSVGLTGGHPEPMPAVTFIEKAINITLEAYIPLRKSLRGGHNVLSATGRIMGLRRKFAKSIHEPKETISNDGYIYFSSVVKGWKYRYAPDAKVLFRSPQTLYDHVNQNTRFDATQDFMKRYFPSEIVDREYYIPAHILRVQMLKQFIKHPILAGAIFFVNVYCKLNAKINIGKINSIWEIVYSTKKVS